MYQFEANAHRFSVIAVVGTRKLADVSCALHRAAPHQAEWSASLPRERDMRPGNELHERESELDERAIKRAITQDSSASMAALTFSPGCAGKTEWHSRSRLGRCRPIYDDRCGLLAVPWELTANSWSERVRFASALFQSSNNVRAGFSNIDPACCIQIDVNGSAPFGADVHAPLKTFISPPIKHHEKVVIRE